MAAPSARRGALLGGVLLLGGCSPSAPLTNPPPPDLLPGPGVDLATPDLARRDLAAVDQSLACRVDKMAFTRDTSCQNDGSVEFCVPAADPAAVAAVKQIAPAIRCAGIGGRAGCQPQRELLCLFSTTEIECDRRYGALRDEPWSALCQIAALPFVGRIVHTIFE